jgi:hypothetical protein
MRSSPQERRKPSHDTISSRAVREQGGGQHADVLEPVALPVGPAIEDGRVSAAPVGPIPIACTAIWNPRSSGWMSVELGLRAMEDAVIVGALIRLRDRGGTAVRAIGEGFMAPTRTRVSPTARWRRRRATTLQS